MVSQKVTVPIEDYISLKTQNDFNIGIGEWSTIIGVLIAVFTLLVKIDRYLHRIEIKQNDTIEHIENTKKQIEERLDEQDKRINNIEGYLSRKVQWLFGKYREK